MMERPTIASVLLDNQYNISPYESTISYNTASAKDAAAQRTLDIETAETRHERDCLENDRTMARTLSFLARIRIIPLLPPTNSLLRP